MALSSIYYLALTFVLCSANTSSSSKLLVFLLDGFRWDYFNDDLPGFQEIIRDGVKADYMVSDNPTNSYPNYYSLMTGLHTESHGMVGNYMYDVKHNETFLIGTNPEQYHSYWWDDAEPLWISTVKQGKTAYMYYWPGCEVEIRGKRPTHCEPYSGVPTISDLRESIDKALALFDNNTADLIGIYVELPDRIGHQYGPGSSQLIATLKEIDTEMKRLIDKLKQEQLRDKVNILMFSDHGMAESSESRVVNITNHIDMDDIDVMLDRGSGVHIWPKAGKKEKVYDDLMNMNSSHMLVYKKEDIPDSWYYKNHYRTAPINLFADLGWYILTPNHPEYPEYLLRGMHGYEKNLVEMRAMFLATGPAFKKNYKAKAFTNVNVYQIMCKILDVEPAPHNGTWSLVRDMMMDGGTSGSGLLTCGFVLYLVTFVLTGTMLLN